ncbi:MAG: hypothetical protein JSR82_03735 [Verrucomicrobia bacterium]|nr:hypothetical protein [Verrucomicrobiota bacterium]
MSYEAQDEHKPFGYIGGYPIDLPLLIVMVHVGALVACCLLSGLGFLHWVTGLAFLSPAILDVHQYWRVVTYPLLHLPADGWQALWFAFELYVFAFTGREVERYLGRRFFSWLYAGLVAAIPAALLVASPLVGPTAEHGSWIIHVSFLVAFAVISPSSIFCWLPVKWLTALILAGHTLAAIAKRDFSLLIGLWTCTAITYVAVRRAGVGEGLDIFAGLRERFRRPPPPVRSKTKSLSRPQPTEDDATMESVDAVLEKISQQGLGSLTAGERATLERARATLLNKGKK